MYTLVILWANIDVGYIICPAESHIFDHFFVFAIFDPNHKLKS